MCIYIIMRCKLSLCVEFVCLVLTIRAQCPNKCVCSVDSGGDVLTNCSRAQLIDAPREEFDSETIVLDLSWNHVKILRNYTFLDRKLYKIERLDLSNNKYLSSIESIAFAAMSSLKYLDLSCDDLAEVSPIVFKPFKKRLEVLILSHNPYLELPNEGFQLFNLRELHLENNRLKSLPNDFFKNMKSIQLINLRHNKLSTLDTPIFESLHALKTLYLSNNVFTMLPLGILRLPKSLTELEMSENQWTCDCTQKMLLLSHEGNNFLENIICTTPKELYNQTFTKKLAADLLCETTTTVTTTLKTTTTTTMEGGYFNKHFPVTEVLAEPFLLRRSNIKMKSDQLINVYSHTATEEIVHAGVLQGTGESWLVSNHWWIICLCGVAVIAIVAVVVVKKVNIIRRKREENEVVSVDEETVSFKMDYF